MVLLVADEDDRLRSFTSWKLDLLDAMSVDPRLTASDFRVAFRLMQHVNAETGACFPSQEVLSDEAVMKERGARQCIANLKRHGWIAIKARSSGGRGKSNFYQFMRDHVNAMLDRIGELQDARKEKRQRSVLAVLHRHEDAGNTPTTGMSVPVPTGMRMPPNTLSGTPSESLALKGDTPKGRINKEGKADEAA